MYINPLEQCLACNNRYVSMAIVTIIVIITIALIITTIVITITATIIFAIFT